MLEPFFTLLRALHFCFCIKECCTTFAINLKTGPQTFEILQVAYLSIMMIKGQKTCVKMDLQNDEMSKDRELKKVGILKKDLLKVFLSWQCNNFIRLNNFWKWSIFPFQCAPQLGPEIGGQMTSMFVWWPSKDAPSSGDQWKCHLKDLLLLIMARKTICPGKRKFNFNYSKGFKFKETVTNAAVKVILRNALWCTKWKIKHQIIRRKDQKADKLIFQTHFVHPIKK